MTEYLPNVNNGSTLNREGLTLINNLSKELDDANLRLDRGTEDSRRKDMRTLVVKALPDVLATVNPKEWERQQNLAKKFKVDIDDEHVDTKVIGPKRMYEKQGYMFIDMGGRRQVDDEDKFDNHDDIKIHIQPRPEDASRAMLATIVATESLRAQGLDIPMKVGVKDYVWEGKQGNVHDKQRNFPRIALYPRDNANTPENLAKIASTLQEAMKAAGVKNDESYQPAFSTNLKLESPIYFAQGSSNNKLTNPNYASRYTESNGNFTQNGQEKVRKAISGIV